MDCPVKNLVRAGTYYCEFFGLSTEDKPTTGLVTGSYFVEQDTGHVYSWNSDNNSWYKILELGGGA